MFSSVSTSCNRDRHAIDLGARRHTPDVSLIQQRNLQVTILLEHGPRLEVVVICLQGCKNSERVASLARVLLLFKINRKRSNHFGKIALIVVLRRNAKIGKREIAGHQRLPSGCIP